MISDEFTDIKYTNDSKVSCSGNQWSAHPIIYLDLSSEEVVSCPYCGQKFKRKWIQFRKKN